jgi:hypothetical protein
MADKPLTPKFAEISRLMDVTERAMARYRTDPSTANLASCFLSYFETAMTRMTNLTDRLEAAEAEIKVLRGAAAATAERTRLRPGSVVVPTAPHGGVGE